MCHYLPPHEGGIERVVSRLADGYVAAGHQAVLVAWGDPALAAGSRHRVVALRGSNVLEAHGVPVPLLEPVSSWRRLGRILSQVDAIHVHGLPYPIGMLTLLANRTWARPLIVTEHVGAVPYDSALLRVVQSAALRASCALARRGARAVTVLNTRISEEIRPLVAPVPVVKVANGVDLETFRPPHPGERAALRERFGLRGPTAISVGRNVAKKGMRHLVVAAAAAPALDLVLVGAGTTTLAAAPTVRANESMAQEDLALLYRAADVLVLPSEGEGLPLVVQEALASGLPVVMGDDPAVRAELPEGPIRYVAPTDTPGLRAAIDELLGADRDELRRTARAEAEARFDWATAVDRYLELMGLGT